MARSIERRTLLASCLAHVLHDGYTDLTYVLLPIWQAELGIGYALLATLRGLYAASTALLQVPAGRAAQRFGAHRLLVLGTVVAALGYICAGRSGGLVGLCIGLSISGAGASVQHPIGSSAVSRAYAGKGARAALGTYNFSGDLGKAALPALLSLLLTFVPWRPAVGGIGVLGLIVAAAVAALMPRLAPAPKNAAPATSQPRNPAPDGAFTLLLVIGVLDTAVRVGLLTFLPFLLERKGATVTTTGLALALVFIGGAAGKLACSWLGQRIGVLGTVIVTEGGTAVCIAGLLFLPLHPTLVLLPLLGIMLNGTSSVLYGTVPELVADERAERAFALFYTGVIGAGAVAPVLYGVLGDAVGPVWASAATAVTALTTLPLAVALSPHLATAAPAAAAAR